MSEANKTNKNKNTVQKSPEIMALLNKYRLSAVATGVLETTSYQMVDKVASILATMIDNNGVTFKDGKFYDLTGAVLQDWQAGMVERNLAPRTRNNYTILLNEFIRWGCGRGLFVNPQTDVPLWQVIKCGRLPNEDQIPEEERKEKFLTEDQVETLITQMPGNKNTLIRDKAIVAMFVGSGIRNFSLCGMNIGDYKMQEHGRIRIKNKGGAWKKAHLADFAYGFIDAYLETRPDKDDMNAPLFLTQQHTRFNKNSLRKTIGRKQEKLGIPTGIHIFRHTFTSAAEKAGGMAVARDLAIHKSIVTTNIYAHTTEDDLKSAVNAMPWSKLNTRSRITM